MSIRIAELVLLLQNYSCKLSHLKDNGRYVVKDNSICLLYFMSHDCYFRCVDCDNNQSKYLHVHWETKYNACLHNTD